MTLEQLAEASKLTPNYIGTIENGKRDPSLSTVIALARGLRVSPGEFFGGIEDLSPPATEAGLLFDGAPAEVQEAVLHILRSVSQRRRAVARGHEYVAMAVGDYVPSNYPNSSLEYRARGRSSGSPTSTIGAGSNMGAEEFQINNALKRVINVIDGTSEAVRKLGEDAKELERAFVKFGSHVRKQIR